MDLEFVEDVWAPPLVRIVLDWRYQKVAVLGVGGAND
jgi:hypothetical protein